MSLTQISYLIRADRTKALRHKLINVAAGLASAIAVALFIPGPIGIVVVIAAAAYAIAVGALPASMLLADHRVAKLMAAHADTITERGQKIADTRAATVHEYVMDQLVAAGKAPVSLAIIVINATNRMIGGEPTVLISTIDTAGALETDRAEDTAARWILRNMGSPFVTASDWRASVIAAEPGKPPTAQLMDSNGRVEVVSEWDKPYDEQFSRYHPRRYSAA